MSPLSTDLTNIDGLFSELGEVTVQFLASIAAVFILLVFLAPVNLLLFAVALVLYMWGFLIIRYPIRDTRRYATMFVSPVITNINEYSAGRNTIRPMKLDRYFLNRHFHAIDRYLLSFYNNREIDVFCNVVFFSFAGIIS